MDELEQAREELRQHDKAVRQFNETNQHIFDEHWRLQAKRRELSLQVAELEKADTKNKRSGRAERVMALFKSDAPRQPLKEWLDGWPEKWDDDNPYPDRFIFVNRSGIELDFRTGWGSNYNDTQKPRIAMARRILARGMERQPQVEMRYVKADRRGEVFVEDVVVFPKEALE